MENLTREEGGRDLKLSQVEQAVATLWKEILQTKSLAKPMDDFFALGGSSIDMVMLLVRIQEEFSIELADGAVFQAPLLHEMTELVAAACETSTNENAPHLISQDT